MVDTVIPYPDMLAHGFEEYVFGTTTDLYAGSSDIVTDQGQAGAGAIPQFAVIGRNAAGFLVAVGAAGTPEGKAIGIAAQPIPANKWGPYFSGGTFNPDALGWPAAADTLAERKALFDGSNIGVRKLL